MGMTQTPLPGPDAALLGLAALVVVNVKSLWSLAKHLDVMAHEGMHAITGTILGLRVRSVELKRNGDGKTNFNAIAGGSGVFTGFVGYLGPSAFGLAAAGLIKLGYIIAVLWLGVLFLVVLLWKVLRFRSFGWVSVPIAIALLLALTHYAPVSLQVVMAYGMTWLLLMSGVREATTHGTNAGDALLLKRMTHIPRWLWALLWVAGTFGAVYIGWRLLVV
jgi:hypothetical protein